MNEEVADPAFVTTIKNPRGKRVTCGQKIMLYNTFVKLKSENEGCSKKRIVKKVSETVGIGKRKIWETIKEIEQTGSVKPLSSKRMRKDIFEKMDEDEKKKIRQIVHSFFLRNELPTLRKVLTAVTECEEVRPFSKTTLIKILKKLGFVYEKRGRKYALVEKPEIVLWRRNYLRKIKRFRNQGRQIFYLDETWINAGHTRSKVWKDTTVVSARQAFVEGLSTGLANPSGKGKRFIVSHIGNENGFVPGGLLIFESKQNNDYHEEMTGEVFEGWLHKVLDLLPPHSVIVMDNAPYHSVKAEKSPTTTWKKGDILAFLQQKGVEVPEGALKVELLSKVKEFMLCHPVQFRIDIFVEEKGHEILRLPPYHCQLNPIELIWAQVKGYVAANNKTFKLADVKNLFSEGLAGITADKWRNCVNHILKVEDDMYRLDEIVENLELEFTVNTGSSDESIDDDLEHLTSDSDV